MTSEVVNLAALDERMRMIAREEARPAFVHQRNSEQVTGIPGRQYLRDAHARHFPSTKERRLVVARTEDVIAFYDLRIRTASAPAANDANAEAIELRKAGARWVSR